MRIENDNTHQHCREEESFPRYHNVVEFAGGVIISLLLISIALTILITNVPAVQEFTKPLLSGSRGKHIPPALILVLMLIVGFLWATIYAWLLRFIVGFTKHGSSSEEVIAGIMILIGVFIVLLPGVQILTKIIVELVETDGLLTMIASIILFYVYLAPSLLADYREHHNSLAIFLTNILLGWTILGWIISLIWAATAVSKKNGSLEASEVDIKSS